MDVGKKVAELRNKKGWSQGELARRSDLKQSQISQLELGKKKNPTRETLSKICNAFGVSMAEFDDKPANDLAHMHEVGDRMNFQGERKAAWEKIKAMSADEQRTQLDEALAEVMALSPEAREHLLGLLREIKRGE